MSIMNQYGAMSVRQTIDAAYEHKRRRQNQEAFQKIQAHEPGSLNSMGAIVCMICGEARFNSDGECSACKVARS